MINENHFTRRLLSAADNVKDSIDSIFNQVTKADSQSTIFTTVDWKNAKIFAQESQVKRADLQKCFVGKYGKKISEYQLEMKITAACILLGRGEMTKKEIAIKCGYSNQNHFSYAFKKQKHMTPTEWQRRYQL